MRYKQYKLSDWCKRAQITMLEKDITTTDVANEIGYTTPYVTSVLNGRLISDTAINKISEFLGISNEHD